ncbi:MAG: phosphoglucosamine mutase [Actinobacteria bacterium]|nr:phosphoglucosamine mutase [Actinomycetota bacterium]
MPGERRYFGTDGVRGVVGVDLTEGLVAGLGRAFATWSGGAPVLIGRDTRASGAALELALSAGLAAGGSEPSWGGILPTAAVALLAEGAGAVISASHNPPEYNGVKFFAPGGRKLTDEEEAEIEALLEVPASLEAAEERWPETDDYLRGRYVELVIERFGTPLRGLRLACDCANGALSALAPLAFERLGALVTPLGNAPDGMNINVGCGATDLGLLAQTVRDGDFDLGVAFDGDGDRMLAVDAAGTPLDGDQILAVLALHLDVGLVAVTSLTNLGFHRLMAERGIRVLTTDVGDRYVREALEREGGRLGGEQSGHVIYLNGQTTGDGLATALLLCRALVQSGEPLERLAAAMTRFPQATQSVPVRVKVLTDRVRDEERRLNTELEGRGRVMVRPSGTEPVVRVLAEAESMVECERACSRMAAVVATELG